MISLQEPLIDIGEDGNLLAEFQQKTLHNWWMEMKNNYEDLESIPSIAIFPFGSMPLCMVSFFPPAITLIKIKYQNNRN